MPSLPPVLDGLLGILSDDPASRIFQLSVLMVGIVSVYLLFYATRDILLRSSSIPLQLLSIFLVALLPIAGFFLYLLLRPARTVAEREMMQMLRDLSHSLRTEAMTRGVAKAVHAADTRRVLETPKGRSGMKGAPVPAR